MFVLHQLTKYDFITKLTLQNHSTLFPFLRLH